MSPETSPFSPGQPVSPEFFVGRSGEIERLRDLVRRSARGKISVGFVSGERGIGKSSLAAFVRHLTEHDSDAVGCHVHLGGVSDVPQMLRQILNRLLNESIDKPWRRQVTSFLGNRVQPAGPFGASMDLNLTRDELENLAEHFVPSIKNLLSTLPEPKRTIFLVLDDINGLATSEMFANWLKSSVDEFATSATKSGLCILVVGLEEKRRELLSSQPSLARVFDVIDIAPWTDEEVFEFYEQSFKSGGATMSRRSMQGMVSYTGGLPVLAHEIGDAVWRTARAKEIERYEVVEGIILAATVTGAKHLEPTIRKALQSDRYRSILRTISEEVQASFRRSDVLARLDRENKPVLENFLRRMKEIGVIESDPEVRGGYCFPNRLYALYFNMDSLRHSRHRRRLLRAGP